MATTPHVMRTSGQAPAGVRRDLGTGGSSPFFATCATDLVIADGNSSLVCCEMPLTITEGPFQRVFVSLSVNGVEFHQLDGPDLIDVWVMLRLWAGGSVLVDQSVMHAPNHRGWPVGTDLGLPRGCAMLTGSSDLATTDWVYYVEFYVGDAGLGSTNIGRVSLQVAYGQLVQDRSDCTNWSVPT